MGFSPATFPPARPTAVDDDGDATILVVDDQASNLEAIEVVLAQSHCQLVRAQSADAALLALLEGDFAAIILDIRMPGMDGLELAELIKQRTRTRHVPILFLTAHLPDESEVLRGYGTGAVDYLVKPIHSAILRSKVSVFVELYRKTRALARANHALQLEAAERERVDEALREANRELERRVQDRTEALQLADRRKDEFLASLAHELRNPLAPVRAAVELMGLAGSSAQDVDRARAVIVRQVGQMTRLIDDLLDVSRIANDKLVLQVSRVDLSQVVAAAVETSRPFIADRGHQLWINLPVSVVVLDADPERLAQVLSNLLTNAAKYTPPGGDIRIIAELVDDAVTIRVIDTGIGIDASLLPHVFDLFVQGDHPLERAAGGLGIGLTLARRIVEMHGGTIQAFSDGLNRGSEFRVQLSRSRSAEVARSVVSESRDQQPSPRRRILVVDDNPDAAEMLDLLLTAWGQETRVANDGLAALDVGGEFRPDLVLLDIGLPHLDGYETARRIRAEEWGQTVVIVAVTGWGKDADRQRSRAAGFDEHLVKPVSPETLRAIIARPRRTVPAAGS